MLAIASIDRVITFGFGNKAFFDPWIFGCDANTTKDKYISIFSLADLVLTTALPCISICCNNIYLITMAVKLSRVHTQRARPRVKGTVTVILVCCTYLLSFFPLMVAEGISYAHDGERGWLFIIAKSSMGINVIVNPVIYTVTNRRFCNFMKLLISGSLKQRRSERPRPYSINMSSTRFYSQHETHLNNESWSSVIQTEALQK